MKFIKLGVLLFGTLLLSACSAYKGMDFVSLSANSWKLQADNMTAQVIAEEQKHNEVFVKIDLASVVYNPDLLNESFCNIENRDNINFSVNVRFGNYNGAESKEQYKFDASQVYFLKGDNKHYLKYHRMFGNKDVSVAEKFDLSEGFRKDKNTKDPYYNPIFPMGHNIYSFKSPFICGELEETVLVIDGIYVNGVKLDPIKVSVNYVNLSSLPLYNN